MTDLTVVIDKPLAILPMADGVPKIGNSGMTAEQALNLAVNETLKAIAKPNLINTANIVQQVLHEANNPQNTTLELVAKALQLSGITNLDKVNIRKVLTDLKLPTGLSSYAINLTDSLNELNHVPDTYGIYHPTGKLAIDADSVLELSVAAAAKIASHPVQQGAFASYNKVQDSDKITLRLAKNGHGKQAKQMRDEFLATLERLKQSTALLDVVAPNATYRNMTITGYNYRFSSGGSVGLLVAEVQLEAVRQVNAQYTNSSANNPDGTPAINQPQSVNAASPQSGGMANPKPATPDERNWVQKAVDWLLDKIE